MTAMDAVVDHIRNRGIEVVFGLPGDDLSLLRALEDSPVRLILCRDQRNAVFMATGYAVRSNGVGVCFVGKGPALTNALSGVLEARSSGVPLVLIAGGTALERRGTGAFQELNQLSVVGPLVKWAARIDHPSRLVPVLKKAFLIAHSGAPGPVYLEIPDHLLDAEVTADQEVEHQDALATVRASKRPIVLVGGGMRGRNDDRAVESFADRINAAVAATASGRGVVDEAHPAFIGLAGLYAPEEAKPLWHQADLLISLGSRLEETAVYERGFIKSGVPVVQVNIDAVDVSTDYPGVTVVGEGAAVLATWLRELGPRPPSTSSAWRAEVADCRIRAMHAVKGRLAEMAGTERLHVAEVLAAVDRIAPPNRILVQENGLLDMWSYFYPFWQCGAEAGSVVPSEQTTLGYGTAAAGGVRLAAPDAPVIAFVGDGAFTMVASDITTLANEGVGVLYVVLSNGGYGWLQSQLGTSPRFDFLNPNSVLTPPSHPNIWHAAVTTKAALDDLVSEGLAESGKGRVAVLVVPLGIDDRPPGIVELDGDFPGAALGTS